MSQRDELFLEHVVQAIEAIERYPAAGEQAFFGQALIQDAVFDNKQAQCLE